MFSKPAARRFLPFLPAFPQMGRITRGGIHYIDGVPVTESPFGKDPFEPVTHSAVTELVREQSSLPVSHFPALRQGERIPLAEGILIFDAEREEELITTGRQLLTQTGLPVMAGCAGFGSVLPQLLGMKKQETVPAPKLDPRLLVICGSVNTITLAQLDRAENAGFARMRLTPRQKLEQGYWESDEGKEELKQIEAFVENHPHAMIETNDPGGNEPTAAYAGLLGWIVRPCGYGLPEAWSYGKSAHRRSWCWNPASDWRRYPFAVHELHRCPGTGAGVRAGKRDRAGAVCLGGMPPVRDHKIRRFRPGAAFYKAGRTDQKQLK